MAYPLAKPTIYNKSMTTANTEYSQALPAGTKRLEVKLRALNALLYVSFVTGMATYFTVPYGDNFKIDAKLGGMTVYVKSPTASQTAEITCWK